MADYANRTSGRILKGYGFKRGCSLLLFIGRWIGMLLDQELYSKRMIQRESSHLVKKKRSSRSSFEKGVAIVLTILAVVSPLYVNQKPTSDPELEQQSMDLTSWLGLLLVLLILAFVFWHYLNRSFMSFDHHRIRPNRSSSYERLVAIGLIVIGILSPLYMNKGTVSELESDEQPINFASWLPLLLLILILAIALSLYCDRSFTRFDPNWIHRVGGSSAGILLVLLVLAFVLKCKTSGLN